MNIIDLEFAYDYANTLGQEREAFVFVTRSTGELVYYNPDEEAESELDLEEISVDDDYVQIPDKFDLDLGKELVWGYVRENIPALEGKVRDIFRKRGAYRRYKDFLVRLDLLDSWHAFENERTREALANWCKDNGISLEPLEK